MIILALAYAFYEYVCGQLCRHLIEIVLSECQPWIFLDYILNEFGIVFGTGVVKESITSEIDLLFKEKVRRVSFYFGDNLICLIRND